MACPDGLFTAIPAPTRNAGIIVERLGGIETWHGELLEWIEQWISR
jgi:hypothetical protein